MSKIKIKYMSDEAVATLKANMDIITQKLSENPDDSSWLEEFIGKNPFVTKKYEIEDFSFKLPKDSSDRETDIENSIMLYEHLKELPLYVLTDERFWLWMNFEKGYSTAIKYMPVKTESSVFKDHWLFSQGKRRGLFFGVLSRCYLRVLLTVDETLEDPYEYSKFVINNPNRFRNLSWRTFSGEKKIVLGALKAEKRVLDELEIKENSKYFTELAKEISKLGSCMLLDVMSEKDVEEYVYKKYKALVV